MTTGYHQVEHAAGPSRGVLAGESFLSGQPAPEGIFTPEDLDAEQKLLGNIVEEFVKGEVEPRLGELEEKAPGVMSGLLRRAAEIGLLGVDVPETFGGMGLAPSSSLVITERVFRGGPFGLTQLVHTAFGALPIVYFGTPDQKARYLPELASGRSLAAFALTEPDAGSDVLGIGTVATLAEDGEHYALSGSKQFTSNSGQASLIVAFAKVDGERFGAFLVDRHARGVSLGEEEKKMGIRGSSTRAVVFDNVEVPRGDTLLAPGQGHLVAFNVLNVGRHRLAGACTGSARIVFEEAMRYARNRRQFGRAIASFGLIKEKIAGMAVRLFASESVLYRTAGALDAELPDSQEAIGALELARRIGRLALECSLNKVHASEMLRYVTDEAVQIHGGYGYLEDYPVERHYRDARIYRIFGGTNEINRLLVAKAFHGAVRTRNGGLAAWLEDARSVPCLGDSAAPGDLQEAGDLFSRSRRLASLALGAALEAHPLGFGEDEEVAALVADLLIEVFAMESCLLRAGKIRRRWGSDRSDPAVAMASVYLSGASARVEEWARRVFAATPGGTWEREGVERLKELSNRPLLDGIARRRSIAEFFLEVGRYAVC